MITRNERREIQKTVGKIQKKLNKTKFKCLFPGCENFSISSHSQQKEGQLRAISKDGLVYALDRNIYERFKYFGSKPSLNLKKTGISEVTTFPGYCAFHDNKLFKSIESRPLKFPNSEQAFLLYLRSYSYEYLQKLRMRFFLSNFLYECSSILGKEKSLDIEALKIGMDHFVDDEAPVSFQKLFTALKDSKFDVVNYWWKSIPKNIGISSSCCFSPLFDKFHEHRLANWNDPQAIVSFNVIPSTKKTEVILVWLNEFNELINWIKNYDSSNRKIESLINHCAFSESEDTCINVRLWEETPSSKQNEILNAMGHSLYRGPLESGPNLVQL